MQISPISTNPAFDGRVIVKNKLSSNQNYLFNLHKEALDKMIKDMPFDLFVEQSKSGKTISLGTSVEQANTYFVRRNHQNFEEAAGFAIEDGKKKSKNYQDMVKANNMLNLSQGSFVNVIMGNFKLAREQEKELAKIAVKDFDVYKKIPHIRFANAPWSLIKQAFLNGMKYKVYKVFSSKIPEEKQFLNMKKDYLKQLKTEKKELKTLTITMPNFY